MRHFSFLTPMPKRHLTDNLVVKSNELINASYAMTVNEQKLLLACISQIDSRSTLESGAQFVLGVEEARDLFYSKADQRHAFRDLDDASRRLFERKVSIDLGDGRELLTRFVQSAVFDPSKGTVTLHFANEIVPYLSQLQANFTQYRLSNIVQLTSSHAVRIYELIVSWTGQGLAYKEMEIEEFREMLGLGEKYKLNGQLKDRVVNPAVSQINESTDFELDISFKKSRRTFKWIQLRFNQKAEAAAAAAEARKQRDARALQNQAAKANRAIQEQKQAAAAAVQTALSEWQSLPDGSIFAHQDGSVWRKDGSTLYSKEKNARIVEAQIPHLLASGQLAHLPPHPPAPPLPTEEESEAQMWQIPATDDEQEEFNVAQNELTMKEQRLLELWERGLITREEYLSMILPPEPPPDFAPDDPSAY
jgi:hypothetical protein